MPAKLTPPVSKSDHLLGSPDALIELVEYGDYQCPHCGLAHPILKKIRKTFGKKLRFAFRHFPLSNVHEYALPAALAAEAADKQQRFWEMHDMIYEHQQQLNGYALLDFALDLRLNIPLFKMDIQDPLLAEKVERDFESGVRSGVNGTPSFFINGYKYNGAYDYPSLTAAIQIFIDQKEYNKRTTP
jgi:protein-disulfide isomerase